MKIFRYFTNVCQWMEDFLDSNSEHSFFFHPGTSWSHLVFSVLLLSPAVWSHCTVHQWLPGLHGYEERSSASGLHLLLPLQTDQPGCCMCDHLSVDLLMFFFFLFSFDFYFTLYVIHWIVLLFLFNWCCFLGSVCPSLCLWSVTDCQSIRLMFLWCTLSVSQYKDHCSGLYHLLSVCRASYWRGPKASRPQTVKERMWWDCWEKPSRGER